MAAIACCLGVYFTSASSITLHLTPVSLFTASLLVLGTLAAQQVEPEWGKDSYRVVIDEVAGMWISLLFIPITASNLLVALILFRFFDIAKPFGIRSMEQLPGGVGVMMDDVLAGIYANVLLQLGLHFRLL